MSHITLENLNELLEWIKDNGFETHIDAIFSNEHDYMSVLDDYPECYSRAFSWGLVVYTPINAC